MNGTEILEAFKAGNLHEAEEKVFETYNRLAALVIEGTKQQIAQGYLGEAEQIDEADKTDPRKMKRYERKMAGDEKYNAYQLGGAKIKKGHGSKNPYPAGKRADEWERGNKNEDVLDETAYDSKLDSKKKVTVTGVMGAKSKSFKKSFPNMKAFEKWSDSEEAGDYEVHHVVNEDQLDELDRNMGGILDRYSSKIRRMKDGGERLSPKRKEGAELAGKKRWGDKKYGLPEPKVKGVERS